MRRRAPIVDPLADVPARLRAFDPGWLEVAAQGLDGYAEAAAAAASWLEDRRAWVAVNGYRGDPVTWLRDNLQPRRRVYAASEHWRPAAERTWTTPRHG